MVATVEGKGRERERERAEEREREGEREGGYLSPRQSFVVN